MTTEANSNTPGPQVMQYFHLSAELATYIDILRNEREAVLRNEAEMATCISQCAGCPYFSMGRCNICGCGLNLRVRIGSMHCPLGKW